MSPNGRPVRGLKPIVAINKIDKHDERHVEVVNEVFDLFAALDATDDQLEFPILYGSAKEGWMALSPNGPKTGMAPLFDLVLSHVAPPRTSDGAFRMLATTIEADPFIGRVLTGTTAGGLIERLGYVNFYLLTTLAALPGILLFWFMMRRGMIEGALGSAGREGG